MDELSPMLVRLNLETSGYHSLADAGWRTLMSPEVSRTQYIDQLVRGYGFEGPLEAALAYTPNLELVVHAHERFRAGYIAQDLIMLGLRPSEVARLPQCVLEPFASPLEALGWMYVVERTTLLHDSLRQNIVACVPSAQSACAYFATSDQIALSRWQGLGRYLDRAVRTSRMVDEVVAGAVSGFRCWLDWSGQPTRMARGSSRGPF